MRPAKAQRSPLTAADAGPGFPTRYPQLSTMYPQLWITCGQSVESSDEASHDGGHDLIRRARRTIGYR